MPPRPRRDLANYIADDDTINEDGTLFFPVPEVAMMDVWSAFFGGIIIALAGAGLITVAPWLSGALLFVGCGMAALSCRGSLSRFGRALGLGFGVMAVTGALILLGAIFFPIATTFFVAEAAARHPLFFPLALAPWLIALPSYFVRLFRA